MESQEDPQGIMLEEGGEPGDSGRSPSSQLVCGGVILLPVCRPRSRQLALSSRCSCQPLGVTASHGFPGPVVERPGRGGLLPGGRGRGGSPLPPESKLEF